MQEYEQLKAEIDTLAQKASLHLSSGRLSSRATTRDPWIADQVRNDKPQQKVPAATGKICADIWDKAILMKAVLRYWLALGKGMPKSCLIK